MIMHCCAFTQMKGVLWGEVMISDMQHTTAHVLHGHVICHVACLDHHQLYFAVIRACRVQKNVSVDTLPFRQQQQQQRMN